MRIKSPRENVRGMILKFWSWRDISATSNATCLNIVPNNSIVFVYTPLWQVLCNLKERPEIYPETAIPSMHWLIKQTVHIRDLTILTRAVSATRFYGCSMFIRKSICPVHMAKFVGDKPMSCKPGVAGSIPGFSQSVGWDLKPLPRLLRRFKTRTTTSWAFGRSWT